MAEHEKYLERAYIEMLRSYEIYEKRIFKPPEDVNLKEEEKVRW